MAVIEGGYVPIATDSALSRLPAPWQLLAAADLRPNRPAYYVLRLADGALIPGHDEPAVPY